jgi:hypothetical protein
VSLAGPLWYNGRRETAGRERRLRANRQTGRDCHRSPAPRRASVAAGRPRRQVLPEDSISIAASSAQPAASFNQRLSEILPAPAEDFGATCTGGLQIDAFRLGDKAHHMRSHASLLLLVAVATSFGGCTEAQNIRSQGKLAAKLALTLDASSRFARGRSNTVILKLANASRGAAVGCLTEPPTCSMAHLPLTRDPLMTPVRLTDHARCVRHFRLGPGDSAKLETEALTIPSDYPPIAVLNCRAEVSTGKRCHHLYGCYTASVSLHLDSVQILAEAGSQ